MFEWCYVAQNGGEYLVRNISMLIQRSCMQQNKDGYLQEYLNS